MPQLSRILRAFSVFAFVACSFPWFASAGTWVAFQNSYTRGTGSPVTVTSTFTLLNPNTQYTLKAFNGGLQNDTTELVSNSIVSLNGAQVVGPANFNQTVAEVNVTIFPGLTNTLSVQVRGKPGGLLTIQVIGVDNDPPTITASVSPSPNAAGWNNSPVTVTFTCSDKTSGVASCPSPVTVSTEGANQVVSGTATDLAGNTASTSVTINLDMTPPTITGTINPPPDAGGYNSGPVTVTFNCADTLSGVASCTLPISVSGEGSFPETGTAVDVAGNTASTTVTVNISFNYFKIRSWQTNPAGDPLQTGKCLDYGTPPGGSGASVFLNDCANAKPIRVYEFPEYTFPDQQVCQYEDAQTPPNCFHHEVLLYAGKLVIAAQNPLTISQGGTSTNFQYATEYQLGLQLPFTSPIGGLISSPVDQVFRLDGDSIILEGTHASTGALRTPCLDTDTYICPGPPPQLVIQVQNARGVDGSPLTASVRNLSDNEFWDFVPLPGSRPHPTTGFNSALGGAPITTNWQLWNAICAAPQATSAGPTVYSDPNNPSTYGQPVPCGISNIGWGSVIVVSDPGNDCKVFDPVSSQIHDIGSCIDMSGYAPLVLQAGATIRGDRRGTHSGPQLYAAYSREWSLDCDGTCILEVVGDYARVSALHIRGENRSISYNSPSSVNDGIYVNYTGFSPSSPTTSMLDSVTEFIATIDHNDMSDWMTGAIRANAPFGDSSASAKTCTYPGYQDASSGTSYTCDRYNKLVPPPGLPPYPPPSPGDVAVAQDPISPGGAGTLSNVRVTRNFLHHNSSSETGYGVEMGNQGGRFLVEGNTFSWNRHSITGSGEPHSQYRASHNLVMSGGPVYSNPFIGRLQDFDMHGTDSPTTFVGGAGGYYVEIDGNTFLGSGGHDYKLRGYPVVDTYYHGNVSLRNQGDAVQFQPCVVCITTDFPIAVSNSQFADSNPGSVDPTAILGVGDFDGDGDDDLFMATGNTWFYSPGGRREWRYLNSAPDTIYQLLFGDFDGDGRTDVVAMRNGQLVISWGGISAFDVLNNGPLPCNSMSDMAVGDFDGDGHPDIFCADGGTWWISYGGNTPFVQVIVADSTRVKDLRFGDFDGNGTTDVFGVINGTWMVRPAPKGYQGLLYPWKPLPASLTRNPASADGLVVADFDGNGVADIGMSCSNVGAPGWQISYGGAQGWSACNTYSDLFNGASCASLSIGLTVAPCFSLANGAVGHFSGGLGADVLLWSTYNSERAATLWDFPGGAGTPYQLSAPDVDAH